MINVLDVFLVSLRSFDLSFLPDSDMFYPFRLFGRPSTLVSTGGYVPSSNASDDYLAALKADSKQKHRDLHARLEGRALAADEPNPTMKDPEAPALASPKVGHSSARPKFQVVRAG